MPHLKPISHEAIPGALEKAERYRLLNEPAEAESICRDVLEIEPDNQAAIVMLLLSLTDQFMRHGGVARLNAERLLSRLQGDFEQTYYAGIICERWAKAQLDQHLPGHVVYEWLQLALEWYEKAEALSPAGNDDAILRWNACVRLLQTGEHIRPHEASVGMTDDFGMDMA